MQGYGEFDHSKAGTEMTAVYAHHINNELAQIVAYLMQVLLAKFLEVFRIVDML
jgi:hypothetical protein